MHLFRGTARVPGIAREAAGMRAAGLPEPSTYSEWSQLAILRSSWSARAQTFAVRFQDGELATELSTQKRLLWSGDCQGMYTPMLHACK